MTNGTSPATNDGAAAPKKTKICVYCGASTGNKPEYIEAARALARAMAANNISLVYGGGTVGLMGEVAKTLVSLSGPDSVHGIIPEALVRYERDPTYRSKALVNNGNGTNNKTTNGTSANGTATPDSSSKETAAAQQQQEEEEHLPVPEEAVFGRTTIVKDMHTRKRLMAQEVIEGGPGSGFIALSGGYGTVEELFETATWNQLGIHNKGIVLLNINGFYDGLLQWIDKSVEEGFIHGKNKHILVEAKTPEEAIQALRDYKVSEAVYKLSWGNQ